MFINYDVLILVLAFDSEMHVNSNSMVSPCFGISPILEQRIKHDKAFNRFISCLNHIYQSRSKNDPNLEFTLDEVRDVEIPEWIQLVLSVKSLDDPLEKRLDRLSQIRRSINTFRSQISDYADKSEFDKIMKNFYIRVLF